MKKQFSWFGLKTLTMILTLLLFSVIAQAFNPSDYPLSTIDTEYRTMTQEHESEYLNELESSGQKAIHITIHPQVVFSIKATYLNQERPISEMNLKGLEVFQKTFFPNNKQIYDIYQHEILIRDADGKEYWLPIQETFREPFREEYYENCDLTLFLIFSIMYDQTPFIIINEFIVK